ncbi:hypothetical protein GF318_03060 [Candidatus Micrarchaeota archaeon]|nr:hypothetical protein [Candidatus Micrarchaeota archaeon]
MAPRLIGNLLNPEDIIVSGPAGGLWDYFGLAGMALVVSSVIIAFIYMWGIIFKNTQITNYVKQEIFELVVSALIVILIYPSVLAMKDITVSFLLPPDLIPDGVEPETSLYVATSKYYERIDQDMAGWLNMNYVMNVYVDQIASVTPYARPLGVGLVASPLAGLASPIKQLLYNMSVALSVAFIINFAQLSVYIFALQAFLKYYLPLGIFLRCFTPTRRLGGTLIGVAVAFLFVLPAITTITFSMFYHVSPTGESAGPLINFGSMLDHYMGDVFGGSGGTEDTPFTTMYESNLTESGGGLIDMITGAFGAIGRLFTNLIGGFFLMLLLIPMSVVSLAFAVGFIMPAFNILIFTQAAKGLAKSFGEEVDITALTRMI